MEGLEELENFDKKEVENISENEKVIASETVNNGFTETHAAENVSTEFVEKPLSMFDDIGKPTEEDANIKPQSFIESMADKASNDNQIDIGGDNNLALSKVKADIYIELSDLLFMLLCCFMTWDFSDVNQSRFSLNKDRKKAISDSLSKIFALSKEKSNPKKDIMFLIIGSYVPMLIVATMVLVKNMKAKTELKKLGITPQSNKGQAPIFSQQRSSQEFQQPQTFEQFPQNSKAFNNVPIIGNVQNAGEGMAIPQRGRGVVAGVKRGSYKKK